MADAPATRLWSNRRQGNQGDATDLQPDADSLDRIIEKGGLGSDPAAREHGKDLVREFVQQVLDGSMTLARDAITMIHARIAQIDHLISIQLNEVLHHKEFQRLEAAWRGLYYLVDRIGFAGSVKVKVWNANKRELLRDLQASERRESALYRAVVFDGIETLGSEPFDLLLGNYAFGRDPFDMELLEKVARIGFAAHAPFVAAASPQMFRCESFADGVPAPGLSRIFKSSEYAKWNSFRQPSYRHPSGKFAVLTLPGVLLRKPYGKDWNPVEQFGYEEGVDGTDHSKFLWGNPAWAVAAQLGRAFEMGSWCADPSGVPGGGVIRKLASANFVADEGDIKRKGPTEAAVADSTYAELSELGFAPICLDATGSRAVVYDMVTADQPPGVEDEDGVVHKPPPVLLRDVLIHCRIAHYIECIVREKRSWFHTPIQCEQYINRWLAKYIVPAEVKTAEERQRPLLDARVRVRKDERSPEGWFLVEGSVTPNLQKGETPAPIDISVPIVLNRSASEWKPDQNVAREVELNVDRDGVALHEASTGGQPQDSFSAASGALERIADLRSRGILDEPSYLELKKAIVAKMKSLIGAPPLSEIATTGDSGFHSDTVPFAQIHAQIVDLIQDSYADGSDPKARAQHALREMDKLGALNSGDSPLLAELLDTALADTNKRSPADLLGEVSQIAAKIRAHPASPVSKAIAETAEQSGRRAVEEYESKEKSGKPGRISTLWRKLVWPDVEGAFSGGAAGASISPALAAHQVLWPVQIAAAFGVMVGAGLRSGMAYGESRQRSGALRGAQ